VASGWLTNIFVQTVVGAVVGNLYPPSRTTETDCQVVTHNQLMG